MRYLAFLFASIAFGNDFTVCASACNYSDLYVALADVNTVLLGDRLILTANENFDGEFQLFPRTKVRAGSDGFLYVTSSALAALPPIGTRVGPSDALNMPRIRASGGYSALRWEIDNAWIAAVNSTTGAINITTSNLYSYSVIAVGDRVTVRQQDTNADVAPMTNGGVYFVTTSVSCGASCLTITLSTTFGGATLAPITFPEPTTPYPGWGRVLVAKVNPVHHMVFQGLDITYNNAAGAAIPAFLQIGNHEESAYEALPYAIEVDRCYIHRGVSDSRQVGKGIQFSGAIYVHDTYIGGLSKYGGEAIGIASFTAPGPLKFENNYVEATGINFILGGGTAKIRGMVNGEKGGSFTHNYVTKSGIAKARQTALGVSATPPTLELGGCLVDESFYYTNISQGWVCVAGAWSRNDSLALTRSAIHLNDTEKNLYEYKSAKNMLAEGNILKSAWVNAQPGECFLMQSIDRAQWASPWTEISSNTIRGNKCQNTSGLALFQLSDYAGANPNKNNLIENNVFSGLGSYGGTGDFIRLQNGQRDNSIRHMTVAGYYGWRGLMTYLDAEDLSAPVGVRYALADMILPNTLQMFSQTCASAAAKVTGLTLGTFTIQNASSATINFDWSACATVHNVAGTVPAATLFENEAGGDFRVRSTSAAYRTASDGKDVGADIDYVDALTDGVVAGTPSLQSSIQISPGSTRAVVSLTSPTACTFALYTEHTRTTLSTDTTAGANQLDSRVGNVVSGSNRQIVLGTVSALTPSTSYWYKSACGTRLAVGTFKTLPTGAAVIFTAQHSAAVSGEYSSSADMTSPTSLSASTSHAVDVPSASVRYYRRSGGETKVFVAR